MRSERSKKKEEKREKDSLILPSGLHVKALSVEPSLGVKKRTRLSERSEGVCSF
jgi:hypothetical protein